MLTALVSGIRSIIIDNGHQWACCRLCVICQLTAASNGVGKCKLLMGFNCERWTDDMGDLRNFSFITPLGHYNRTINSQLP
ncbi:hypothetical protein D917_02172 [Trichinella nativa]|uniref:Uncharacterized protein n=1 Tax=Trichinella nativa TaxID=6335 RepID=A0A1Y3EHY9_9BILA|nr:hypothetical protein D917_02172 [Trichinella nativa]